MVLSMPFRRWLDAGCPEEFDYDGMSVDAQWVIGIEYESIVESRPGSQPVVLTDADCKRLGIPSGSTTADAIQKLSGNNPLDHPLDR
ncbi:MAG: hypothetical protein ACJ75G_03965 [Gaiellaceae bacterium]